MTDPYQGGGLLAALAAQGGRPASVPPVPRPQLPPNPYRPYGQRSGGLNPALQEQLALQRVAY